MHFQRELLNMLIECCKHWKFSTARMARTLKDCQIYQNMFLKSDLSKLCLKRNQDITKLFPE